MTGLTQPVQHGDRTAFAALFPVGPWMIVAVLAASAWAAPMGRCLHAQGVATAAVRGSVVAADGTSVDGARVRVVNTATGYFAESEVRHGRFLVQGLDVGGPYSVTVSRLGLQPAQQDRLFLKLGEPLELGFVMQPRAIAMDGLTVVATPGFSRINAHGGTATTIADSLVHRLPTLDRNVYDFVPLAPQISTKVGFGRSGASAAGANFRFNNFLINGADERFVNYNLSAAFGNGKSIPLEAVKEYQVLVAPYDVRYGDFAGALVNTVTNSGTNEVRGSTFALWRNDRLARAGDSASSPYERLQYGFALGGPIVRDRVHFFVAPEFQRLVSPASGPYLGQPPTATPRVPVSAADIARLDTLMRRHNLTAGSGGRMEVANPLRNLYARLDAVIPRWHSRATAFVSYAGADDERFTRSADEFSLSTHKWTQSSSLRVASIRLHTDLPGTSGAHNELAVSHSADRADFLPDVRQPLVRVRTIGTSGSLVTLNAGSPELAQGRFVRAWSFKIRDDASLPLGADHVLRIGVQAERFRNVRIGVIGGYGTWTFSSLDAFERGLAESYKLRTDLGGASASLSGGQYAAWVGDEWRAGARVAITLGVRADLLHFSERAPYNAEVDALFGRRTDEMPRARVHVSPRVGFTWDLSGTGRDQLRGGVGLFTGRPPLAWIVPGLSSYGVGIGELDCGPLPTDDGLPPIFVPDYRAAPTACATGPDMTTALGPVNLLDRNLRMAQSLRASLAYDRRLPWDFLATGELLVNRHVSDFMFVNLNLQGPRAVDRFGRVLYGTIRAADGIALPDVRAPRFSEVIDLTNTSKNYSVQLSARVERRFTRSTSVTASYTYSRTRDVQSTSRVGLAGITMWGDARAVSGRHDHVMRGISLNDLPHRAVAALTYTAPWQRARTLFSLYYVGESGSPFTYLPRPVGRSGDLNADGSNANDPIYVPRDVSSTDEIRFSGDSAAVSAQQDEFERFIDGSPCLREQRGRILERNSCREPWSHTTIAAVRQTIPIGERAFEAGIDVFNVLNLLNRGWGHYRVAEPRLLDHVGQTSGAAGTTQPIYRFDTTRTEWETLETASVFQLQLAVRYRF